MSYNEILNSTEANNKNVIYKFTKLGKRTNGLWSKMNRSCDVIVEWKNYLWIKLDDLNKLGK